LMPTPLYLSRYGFGLEVPNVTRTTQEIADFVSGPVIGTMLAMVFRYWAMNKWVFPKRAQLDDVLSPVSPSTASTPTV
jgi:hypothetical protein